MSIVGAQQDPRPRVLWHLFQMVFERRHPSLPHIANRFFFAHGAQTVQDGYINVVVLTARFNGGFRSVQHFLVATCGEQGTAEHR